MVAAMPYWSFHFVRVHILPGMGNDDATKAKLSATVIQQGREILQSIG